MNFDTQLVKSAIARAHADVARDAMMALHGHWHRWERVAEITFPGGPIWLLAHRLPGTYLLLHFRDEEADPQEGFGEGGLALALCTRYPSYLKAMQFIWDELRWNPELMAEAGQAATR